MKRKIYLEVGKLNKESRWLTSFGVIQALILNMIQILTIQAIREKNGEICILELSMEKIVNSLSISKCRSAGLSILLLSYYRGKKLSIKTHISQQS
jgi:hypothetical protein